MISIPAELENLFTFLTDEDPDHVSILWQGQLKRVNQSLPATSFLLARIESLQGWSFEPGISKYGTMFWSKDEERAILMIRADSVELRLHETEDQYLVAWRYLTWLCD